MLPFLKPRHGGFTALYLLTSKGQSEFSPGKESMTGCFHYYKASGNDYLEFFFLSFIKLEPITK